MQKFIFILFSFIFSSANSQPYFGWNLLYQGEKQSTFYYHVKTISVVDWPPTIIRTPILVLDKDRKVSSNTWWELSCIDKTLKINADFKKLAETPAVSMLNDSNTVRKQILQLLCGFSIENKHWMHFFTVLPNANNPLGVLFADSSDIKKVTFSVNNEAKEGIEISTGYGTWDINNWNNNFSISNLGKDIYSCTEPMIFNKEKNNYVGTKISLIDGSGLAGLQYNLCQGILKQLVKTTSISQSVPSVTNKNVININSAKQKCSELGFKTGTEGFGKCVLQLSK